MIGSPGATDDAAPRAPRLYSVGMTSSSPVLTPRQAAERLGVRPPTLRKHAATLEALHGEPLPRGEHLERQWPEPLVVLLGEALSMVHRQEMKSVEEALRALYLPITPPPVPPADTLEELRALIREEVRAVIRDELGTGLASMSATSSALDLDSVRLVVRQELRAALDPDSLRVAFQIATVTPAAAPAAAQSAVATFEVPSRPFGEVLRWSGAESPRLSKTQADVLGYLRSGAVLVRKGTGGQWWAWWPDGSEQKLSTPTTVEVLRKAGLLSSIEAH